MESEKAIQWGALLPFGVHVIHKHQQNGLGLLFLRLEARRGEAAIPSGRITAALLVVKQRRNVS